MSDKIIEKLTEEIGNNYTKIIDDFCKAYLASRWEDYFSKNALKKGRLELLIRQEGVNIVYSYRIKKGKLKNV
jgi:hypothetical protein